MLPTATTSTNPITLLLDPSSALLQLSEGDRKAIRFRRRSPSIPILAGACFGSSGYGERGERQPVYIFLTNLVDLARVRLVSSSVSLLIGGFLFFGFIDSGGVVSWVRLNMYFRARDFVHGAGILSLQEFSGGPRAVLVRYVLLLPASFGLEFPVPVLRSSSSVN